MAEFCKDKELFENDETERGNALESMARGVFEMEFNKEIREVDFVSNERISKVVGCSPDGFVGDSEMFETKAPNESTYYDYLLDEDKAKRKYYDQCQWQLWCCEKKKNHLFIFNPEFSKAFINIVIERDEEWIKDMEVKIKEAERL